MKSVTRSIGALIGSLLLVLSGCGAQEEEISSGEKINVVTTIAQIGEPISVIGGDRVNVESLMGPSVDPHLYNATQGDIKTVEKSDIIFYNGLDLEANMVEIFDKISESKPVLAVAEELPQDALLEDTEGAVDPHVWFDLNLWRQAIDSAVNELKHYSPEDADYFEENKQQYFDELEKVEMEAEKIADIPENQRVLVTAHDAFRYFGNMHDMEVIGLQGLSTEDELGISDINETIQVIKDHAVPAIFVESSINQDSIQAVIDGAQEDGVDVALGGELYSDAMGESGTEEGTYIGMYRHNLDTIYDALYEGAE
ncbi:manganese transporter [Salibacterium salarium]|uniref:Manganese transporter n=1 Tax=Salibacterium salarium TaxID=284579 RepID=A0A3R9QG80_9BACI|nr:zinc ABC transporter substrate-binding protein [Salibacterium salarium]RSL29859.1 manganese transporter [Salibacterium salarium]